MNKFLNKNLFTFFFWTIIINVNAQEGLFGHATISTEAGMIVSSDKSTPFLLRANQYGLIPSKSQFVYLNANIKKDYDSSRNSNNKIKHFGLGYGFETQINAGQITQILLPQLYFKMRFRAFQFYAGRKREIQGLVDTTGTMGSYIWSGNALPMPKVELSIPNFTPIFRNKFIAIKGNYAHGWFGSTDSVRNYYLHQKSFYVRLGKPNWRIKFYAGGNHQVQWGGSPSRPFYDVTSNQTIDKYPSDLKAYFEIITGHSQNLGIGNTISNQNGVPSNEAGNRIGNHLGSVDLGFEYQGKVWKLFVYRQNLYDDGSLYYLNNIADGLNGISLSKKTGVFRKISIEFLNTTSQGGSVFSDVAPELRGIDNYFNNGIYKDGWTYKGNVIGTPYMQTYGELNRNLKLNDPKNFFNNNIINNRVKILYVSYNLRFNKIQNSGKIFLSSNLGNYYLPFANLAQVSVLQSFQMHYDNKTLINGSVSADLGKLFPTNVGAKVSIKRELR